MLKYAKVLNKKTGLCEVGLGNDIEYHKKQGKTLLDVEQSNVDNNWYLADKCPKLSAQEVAKIQNRARIVEIKQELENIDKQRTRALAEPEIKDIETGETWLEYYNNQAKSLREELKTLENFSTDTRRSVSDENSSFSSCTPAYAEEEKQW